MTFLNPGKNCQNSNHGLPPLSWKKKLGKTNDVLILMISNLLNVQQQVFPMTNSIRLEYRVKKHCNLTTNL